MSRLVEKPEVLVLGGGSFGTAIATILAKHHHVKMWVRFEEQAHEINRFHTNQTYFPKQKLPLTLEATTNLIEAVRKTPVILMVIPSGGYREVVKKIAPALQGDQIIISATKGIEPKTFQRMSEILREESCALKIGVLSGPSLAMEMIQGDPTGVVIASHYDEVIRKAQRLFSKSTLRLFGQRDVIGTEIGGAFKNIVAIMAGAAHGKGFGDNTKSLILTRGLIEMTRYGVSMGADPQSFTGLAGVGDLVATCNSPLSRNFRAGLKLSEGLTLKKILSTATQVTEGIPTTQAVFEQDRKLKLNLPLVHAVYSALFQGAKVEELIKKLMAIPTGMEML